MSIVPPPRNVGVFVVDVGIGLLRNQAYFIGRFERGEIHTMQDVFDLQCPKV
jgi:hypothetical protein